MSPEDLLQHEFPSNAFDEARVAIAQDKSRELEKILAETPGVARERPLMTGKTLLITAAAQGRLREVEILLPLSDPMTRAADGRTFLMAAAGAGHHEIVKIAKRFWSGDEVDDAGEDALMKAVRCIDTKPELVKELILSSSPNRARKKDQASALTMVAQLAAMQPERVAECIQMLAAAEWDPEHQNKDGQAAMHFAVHAEKPFWAVWGLLGEEAKKREAEKSLRDAVSQGVSLGVAEELGRHVAREHLLSVVREVGERLPEFAAKVEAQEIELAMSESWPPAQASAELDAPRRGAARRI